VNGSFLYRRRPAVLAATVTLTLLDVVRLAVGVPLSDK
jgi:hypothetical protein